MNIAFTLKHLELSEHTKAHIEKKLEHLSSVIPDILDVAIRCTRDAHHHKGEIIELSVDVRTPKETFYAQCRGSDVESCIDELVDELKEQARKRQGKRDSNLRKTIRIRRWMKSILFWRES